MCVSAPNNAPTIRISKQLKDFLLLIIDAIVAARHVNQQRLST